MLEQHMIYSGIKIKLLFNYLAIAKGVQSRGPVAAEIVWGPLGEVGCGAHERSESSSFARETRKSAGGLEALNPPRGVRGAAPEFF